MPHIVVSYIHTSIRGLECPFILITVVDIQYGNHTKYGIYCFTLFIFFFKIIECHNIMTSKVAWLPPTPPIDGWG